MLGAGIIAFAGVETPQAAGSSLALLSTANLGTASSASNFTLSQSINAVGANLLVVAVSIITSNYNVNLDSVTFNGTSMTLLTHVTDGNYTSTFFYYLENPAQTTANVVINNTSFAIYANWVSGMVFVVGGANTTTPFQSTTQVGGTYTLTPSLTTTGNTLLLLNATTAFVSGHTTIGSLTTDIDNYSVSVGEQVAGHLVLTAGATTSVSVVPTPSYCYQGVVFTAVQ